MGENKVKFDEYRRIYSFNLASFILSNIDTEYKIVLDEEMKSYLVFPSDYKIKKLVNIYKFRDGAVYLKDLHKFLNIYGRLREESIHLKDRFLENI